MNEWMFILFTFPFSKHVTIWTNFFYTWFQTWHVHDKNLFMFSIFYHSLNFCKYNLSWMVLLLVIFVCSFYYPSSINLMSLYSFLDKLPAFTCPKIDWLVKFFYGLRIFLCALSLSHPLVGQKLGFTSSID